MKTSGAAYRLHPMFLPSVEGVWVKGCCCQGGWDVVLSGQGAGRENCGTGVCHQEKGARLHMGLLQQGAQLSAALGTPLFQLAVQLS